MKFESPIPVEDLARQIGGTVLGGTGLEATGINEIHQVQPGDITFVDVKKYFGKALGSAASIILLNERAACPPGKALILCEDPFEAYNQIVLQHRPFAPQSVAISPTAEVHPTAILEPNVIIGHYVKIGAGAYIQSNVTIAEHTLIGEGVEVQSGSVIGSDAFYFKRTAEGYQPWRSGGRVILEDRVRVGAACTINKGVSGDTVIGAGTKLDCQVHIGHDVAIGQNCLFAAQVGIGGNTVVEDEVVLYGQVGIAQNLTIGAKAVVLAKSGVSKSLEGGKVYFGYPAKEARTAYRELAALRHLPEFYANYYEK
ncbi:LpxD N-terminal domain-containing protein [Phaeodactylibacter luteus]|uniref:UDP-3-O-(3-hydroxymyristoyl)glucosamine N-acyltransferase n=1 Tax=Phaeodactylibacter luteus TaxID=1564516 RepID=A0A5C6RIZ8_9BACT|nr:LpxD N-terminal domain-containing protein [Phaeodactylibacter luteus]TXB62396.1 UDP-3-O-(3-hydroxymyristoyl)glucosamine N-acyltransferase [Phaeodactylibacter luteus]